MLDLATLLALGQLSSANVWTATQQIKSTDAGATAGPTLELYRDSASPAAADDIGQIAFLGRDDAAAQETYARIKAIITDATAASEDAKLAFLTVVAGTLAARFNVGAGLFSEGVTGGDPGAGKINVTGYQQAGMALQPVVQIVNTKTGAVATGTTVLPLDDTIPQNTEGDEYMTRAITPKAATNILKIEVTVVLASSAGGTLAAALFQDTTADALAVVGSRVDNTGSMYTLSFTHYMVAGTTSATTFKVRCGNSAAGTVTFNGVAAGRQYGGVMSSSITITELAA